MPWVMLAVLLGHAQVSLRFLAALSSLEGVESAVGVQIHSCRCCWLCQTGDGRFHPHVLPVVAGDDNMLHLLQCH